MQTSLLDLHGRGATGYAAKPNMAEAESHANELARFARPRRHRICGEAEYGRSRIWGKSVNSQFEFWGARVEGNGFGQ